MNTYHIYRTPKGSLTMKEQEQIVATIRAVGPKAAKDLLNELKKIEKKDGI